MICQYEFDDVFTQLLDSLAAGVDKLAFHYRGMTGRHCFNGTIFFLADLHTANPARTKRIQIGGIAEGWYQVFVGMPAYKGQKGISLLIRMGNIIYISSFHGHQSVKKGF